jgi:hypothetical protein
MGSGTQTLLTQVAPPLYPVAAPAALSSNTGAATAAVAPAAATVGDRFTAGEDETAAPAEAVTVAPAPVTSADKTSAEMGSGTQTLLTQVAPPL